MRSIAAKTWQEAKVVTLLYTVLLEVNILLAIWLWPDFKPEAAAFGRMIRPLRPMFDAIANPNEELAYNAYMALQLFFKGTSIIGLSFAVLLGTGMIARERENQTLEFLLGRPIGRSRVLFSKFAVIAVAMVVPIVLTSLSAAPLSWMIDAQLDWRRLLAASVHASAFALLFLAATAIGSVLCRNQVHVAAAAGAFIVLQVILFFIQTIRAISVFRLADWDIYGPLMLGSGMFGQIFLDRTLWVLLATVLLYVVADRLLQRISP